MYQEDDPEKVALINQHLRIAAETGNVFFVGGFFVQAGRTTLRMRDPNDPEFPLFSTAVTFVFSGRNAREKGLCVFQMDTDDIDDLCAALQVGKNAPFEPEGESTIYMTFNNNQEEEGNNGY